VELAGEGTDGNSRQSPIELVETHDHGFAILHPAGTLTIDEVVFGEPEDLVLLGARTLEGMNLKVDLVGKRLVSAGPIMTAVAA